MLILCLFEDRKNGWKWMFIDVYSKGEGGKGLWKDLDDSKQN